MPQFFKDGTEIDTKLQNQGGFVGTEKELYDFIVSNESSWSYSVGESYKKYAQSSKEYQKTYGGKMPSEKETRELCEVDFRANIASIFTPVQNENYLRQSSEYIRERYLNYKSDGSMNIDQNSAEAFRIIMKLVNSFAIIIFISLSFLNGCASTKAISEPATKTVIVQNVGRPAWVDNPVFQNIGQKRCATENFNGVKAFFGLAHRIKGEDGTSLPLLLQRASSDAKSQVVNLMVQIVNMQLGLAMSQKTDAEIGPYPSLIMKDVLDKAVAIANKADETSKSVDEYIDKDKGIAYSMAHVDADSFLSIALVFDKYKEKVPYLDTAAAGMKKYVEQWEGHDTSSYQDYCKNN
jgi:hypothetical protein